MRGFIVGSLLLIAVEVFVTGTGPSKYAGLVGWSSDLFDKVLSPDHPGIPKVTSASTSAANSSASTSSASPVPGSATNISAISV